MEVKAVNHVNKRKNRGAFTLYLLIHQLLQKKVKG